MFLVDRGYVHRLLRGKFNRTAWFAPNGQAAPPVNPSGSGWFGPRLQLVAAADHDDSNARVHHGYETFVGPGTPEVR